MKRILWTAAPLLLALSAGPTRAQPAPEPPPPSTAPVTAAPAPAAPPVLAAPPADAAPPPAAPPPAAPEEAAPDETPDEVPLDTATQIEDLRQKMADLEQRLEQTRQTMAQRRPILNASAYIDAGFFAAQGNGVGVVQDVGPNRRFPQYANQYAWVFMGDLLSTTINSRGEAASLGNFAGVDRFDSVASNGAPSFIVNEVNLTLTGTLTSHALATASVNFIPRSGANFSLGDFMEVDLAQVEWLPTDDGRTSIFFGKFDSVIGIEYRDRKAVQRFGITPSLISRYTTGTPLGIKARTKLGDGDRVIVAAALTNGSSTTEQFHFYDEVDSNVGKTASGRLAVRPLYGLEVGVSGQYGAQDKALDSRDPMWFFGIDLLAHLGSLDLKGQWLKGGAKGETDRIYPDDHRPYGLALHGGGYLEADWMITPVVGVIGRGEYRDALVWLGNPNAVGGADRLYITKGWRATVGGRFVLGEHVVLKVEYLHNGEYGGVPQIDNDVFTSSLLLMY
jgi:hypothetical protein